MRNLLLQVGGIDAAGKATLVRTLAAAWGAEAFSFPDYDTPTGAVVLGHLKGEWRAAESDESLAAGPLRPPAARWARGTLNAVVRQALMTANKCEAQARIQIALQRGHVLLDRYKESQLAYGVAEGLDENWLGDLASPLLEPDVTVVLDLPAEEAARRRPPRDGNEADQNFLKRVREEYRRLSRKLGWALVDATASREDVARAAWEAVTARTGLELPRP